MGIAIILINGSWLFVQIFNPHLKAPYSSKMGILLSKKDLTNWRMVWYNHKMWHLTACKISVSPSFLNWIKNEMIFYHTSELMLPT